MARILGVAAFGLADTVADGTTNVHTPVFLPSAVLLPESFRGTMIAGRDALESRRETGLYWPIEARVGQSTVTHRVPVAFAWNKLVRDGDILSRWKTPYASFTTAQILHTHLAQILQQHQWHDAEQAVIAIPNRLDEMGQETLLRYFGTRRRNVLLLWRHVAAALPWLDAVARTPVRITQNDWILVVYLGVDAVELCSFTLREEIKNGRRYLLPVRSRPTPQENATGMDWAWNICGTHSDGEIWQCLTRFTELWQAMRANERPHRSIEHPWSWQDGSWRIWNPQMDITSNPGALPLRQAEWLNRQMYRSVHMDSLHSWDDRLRLLIGQAVKEHKAASLQHTLRGIIICGPLSPLKRPAWLDHNSTPEAVHFMVSRQPTLNSIWLPSERDGDIIARGAQLYGQRLAAGEPTYLDTLPSLKILTQTKRGTLSWPDLVAETECPGNQEYTNAVNGFSYLSGHSAIQVYLKKEGEDNYRSDSVHLAYSPTKDTPITIAVRMKPASGLAQVKLETCDNSMPELIFNFSRMEEIYKENLPKAQLICPEDSTIALTQERNIPPKDEQRFFIYYNQLVSPISVLKFTKILKNFRQYCLKSRGKLVFINENGNGVRQDITNSFAIAAKTIATISTSNAALYGDTSSARSDIIRDASYLWARTPHCIVDTLYNTLETTKTRDAYGAAERCFTTQAQYQKLFDCIVTYNVQLNYSLHAAFTVLYYRPDAWQALTKDTCYGLLKIALEMMEKQREEKKLTFRNAIALIWVLLKFRLQEKQYEFLSDKDTSIHARTLKTRINEYIEEIDTSLSYNMHPVTHNNLIKSKEYLKSVREYIEYRGDPNKLPVIDEDD